MPVFNHCNNVKKKSTKPNPKPPTKNHFVSIATCSFIGHPKKILDPFSLFLPSRYLYTVKRFLLILLFCSLSSSSYLSFSYYVRCSNFSISLWPFAVLFPLFVCFSCTGEHRVGASSVDMSDQCWAQWKCHVPASVRNTLPNTAQDAVYLLCHRSTIVDWRQRIRAPYGIYSIFMPVSTQWFQRNYASLILETCTSELQPLSPTICFIKFRFPMQIVTTLQTCVKLLEKEHSKWEYILELLMDGYISAQETTKQFNRCLCMLTFIAELAFNLLQHQYQRGRLISQLFLIFLNYGRVTWQTDKYLILLLNRSVRSDLFCRRKHQ